DTSVEESVKEEAGACITSCEERITELGFPTYSFEQPVTVTRLVDRNEKLTRYVVNRRPIWKQLGFTKTIEQGSEGAALTVIFERCETLSHLCMADESYFDDELKVFFRYAACAQDAYLKNPTFRLPPLPRLVIINFSAYACDYGTGLEDLIRFASLISLKYVVVTGYHDEIFDSALIKEKYSIPCVLAINFCFSSIRKSALKDFIKFWQSSVVMIASSWRALVGLAVGNVWEQDWNYVEVGAVVVEETGLFKDGTRWQKIEEWNEYDLLRTQWPERAELVNSSVNRLGKLSLK
ncbi:hypothetical protein LTR66_015744, partial [Elasticomyces elasticus]